MKNKKHPLVTLIEKAYKQDKMKKYKVIADLPTASGILYKNEIVKEEGNSTLEGHIRVKDNMGRIWFVPKENLQIINKTN